VFRRDDWIADLVDLLDGVLGRDDVPERRVSDDDELVVSSQCDGQAERVGHDVRVEVSGAEQSCADRRTVHLTVLQHNNSLHAL